MAGHRSFAAVRPTLPSAQERQSSRSISRVQERSGAKARADLCPDEHRLCSENRSCPTPTCRRAKSLHVSAAMWPVWLTRRHHRGGKQHGGSRGEQRPRSAVLKPRHGDDHGRCMNGVDARSPVGPGRVPNGHTSVDLPTGLRDQQSPTGIVRVPPRIKLV